MADMVDGMPVCAAELLELAGCHAGDFLKLVRDVGDAAVSHRVGNSTQAQLAVLEQLFDALDLLQDDILFDGDALDR